MKTTKIVIVKVDGWPTELVTVPESMPTHKVVEKMQRNAARLTPGGRTPGVTWKVAESNNIVQAIIESARPIPVGELNT